MAVDDAELELDVEVEFHVLLLHEPLEGHDDDALDFELHTLLGVVLSVPLDVGLEVGLETRLPHE